MTLSLGVYPRRPLASWGATPNCPGTQRWSTICLLIKEWSEDKALKWTFELFYMNNSWKIRVSFRRTASRGNSQISNQKGGKSVDTRELKANCIAGDLNRTIEAGMYDVIAAIGYTCRVYFPRVFLPVVSMQMMHGPSLPQVSPVQMRSSCYLTTSTTSRYWASHLP